MESSAPPRAPGGRRNGRQARNGQELRAYARDRLIESRLTPNAISMVGLFGNLVAAALVTQRLFFLAGVAFILGSVMDTLDGRYSRMSGKGTPFGAFLDSTTDRIGEGLMLGAIALLAARDARLLTVGLAFFGMLGSLLVSYTRARAEALGLKGAVGIGSRAERVVVITAGLVLAPWGVLPYALGLLCVTAWVTVGQRVWSVRQQLRQS